MQVVYTFTIMHMQVIDIMQVIYIMQASCKYVMHTYASNLYYACVTYNNAYIMQVVPPNRPKYS